MEENIRDLIPQYGELNRIYSGFIDSKDFSFEKQKFITDFWQRHSDTKAFEAAILKLVLGCGKEQCSLVLESLRTEIEKNISAYESGFLPDDKSIKLACNRYMRKYDIAIRMQLKITRSLTTSLNEAYNRYDSIGYREHTEREEKEAENEYEHRKAEYDAEKARLDGLYAQQKAARKEALQYMDSHCVDIYHQSCIFRDILKKYTTEEKPQNVQNEHSDAREQKAQEERHEYFSMKLLSLIHEACVGQQFEDISELDFYSNMNLHECGNKLKNKPREKIRVCYLIYLMAETLPKQDRDKWKNEILKRLDIDGNYYKSKYKEPVSDFPSYSNRDFAKEMEQIFR